MSNVDASRRINRAALIKVETTLGSSVTVTRKAARDLLSALQRRSVEPIIEFEDIGDGRFFAIIRSEAP